MTAGAIVATIVMWLVFISGLWFCFSRLGRGGKWED